MRKCVVIGLTVLVVTATAIAVLRAKESPVEYHKRKYLEARDGSEVSKRIRFHWAKMNKTRPRGRRPAEQDTAQMEVHERVLMDLGYLEERTYVIKDLTYSRQMRWLALELKLKFATGGRVNRYNMLEPAIARIVSASTNSVVIRGVREEMPTWDKVAEEFRAVPLAKSD